jgi:hypothetical protein
MCQPARQHPGLSGSPDHPPRLHPARPTARPAPPSPPENFKFSRLTLQAALQSAPQLVLVGWLAYAAAEPAARRGLVINGAVLLQVRLAAGGGSVWGAAALFRGGARARRAGARRSLAGGQWRRRAAAGRGGVLANWEGRTWGAVHAVPSERNRRGARCAPSPPPAPTAAPRAALGPALPPQALIAHAATLIDKALLFNSASRAAGTGPCGHARLVLALKGAVRAARPVLEENFNRWGPLTL